MIIQYASDLHLEFPENKKFLNKTPLQPVGKILLLAGDIVPFAVMDRNGDFFDYISDNFETTYWIPGNHEYYYSDLSLRCRTLNEKIRSNVHLVNNITIRENNVRFIFTTLWTKINPANQWYIERGMSDFQVIKFNDSYFSSFHFTQLHNESLSFLTQELERSFAGNTIVVTHHVPTLLNYPQKYKGSLLNEAFAVELFDLIESKGPEYWIYGHNHHNISDFAIGKTQLLTNQLGYVRYGENLLFNNLATISA